jgi:molybdopterin-guanine dinucleotide biosynthesis protein A
MRPFDIILLAGQRPGTDPLAAHFGTTLKALLEIEGRSMLLRVLDVITQVPDVRTIHVLAQQSRWLSDHVGPTWIDRHPHVHFRDCGPSISGSILDLMASEDGCLPFLVTTADNALLTLDILQSFISQVAEHDIDIAAGMVERRTLLAAYPGNQRTWLKFRGGAFSGANLFWFGSDKARVVLDLWRTIEQHRKKGRAIIGAFGLPLLLGSALRILSLSQALTLAGRRLGIRALPVILPQAEAAIDVDKPSDHALATAIVQQRDRLAAGMQSKA